MDRFTGPDGTEFLRSCLGIEGAHVWITPRQWPSILVSLRDLTAFLTAQGEERIQRLEAEKPESIP